MLEASRKDAAALAACDVDCASRGGGHGRQAGVGGQALMNVEDPVTTLTS